MKTQNTDIITYSPGALLIMEREGLRCEVEVINTNPKDEKLYLCKTPFGMIYVSILNIKGYANRSTISGTTGK